MATENRFLQANRRLVNSQSRFLTSTPRYATAKLVGCAHTRPYVPPPRNPNDEQQRMNYLVHVGLRVAGELFQECITPETLANTWNVLAEAAWSALQQMRATGDIPAPGADGRAWFDTNGQAIDQALVDRTTQAVRSEIERNYRDRYDRAKQGQAQSFSQWRGVQPTHYARPFGVNNLSISASGVDFVKQFEGFRGALYNDPVGHCTIGYGHLVHHGNCNGSESAEFRAGITETRATELLRDSLRSFERSVNDSVNVTLNQTQFDSLVSFSYNVGAGAFRQSTLLRLLNEGNYGAVPTELRKWVKASGQTLPGLVRRREAEANLFTSGTYSQSHSYRQNGHYGRPFADNAGAIDDIEAGESEDGAFGFASSMSIPSYCTLSPAATASSTNFSMTEFNCKDGTEVPQSVRGNVQALMNQLEILRAEVNTPIQVISGYRTPEYNAKLPGAAKQSQHMCGKAADIKIRNMTPSQIHATIERLITAGRMQNGGLGLYPTFVHYDVGPVRRW